MDDRPNILLIMTDQHRGDALGIEGHPAVQTPNMDAIAGAGARFSRCYSTCPVCIPARRSLLSGQFPATHGMVGYRENVAWDAPPTLPGVLRDAGYQTVLVGRDMHQCPRRKRFGYDHMITHGWDSDYYDYLAEHAPAGSGGWFGGGVMHNDWTARPWHLDEGLHATNWTVNQALEFLAKRDPSCPFFLTVSFVAPHPPLNPPAFYFDRYLRMEMPPPVIGDWATPPEHGGLGDDVSAMRVDLKGERLKCAQAGYFGLINHVDDQLRRILNPVNGILSQTGGNTIVIYTADHGEMLGDHYLWRKSLPYEGSARVPLLIRAPERFGIQGRIVPDQPVGLEDIMPTALEMAGVDIPDTVDGRSLLPLMRGEESEWREHLHIEHSPMHHALTDGREKFIWWTQDGREQFFSLADDPKERRDLIAVPAYAERIDAWRRRLIDELKDRPEGFTDGERLIAGRPYGPTLPHAGEVLDTPSYRAAERGK